MNPTPPFPFQPIAEYHAHRGDIEAALQRVLASGWYILGPEVENFEQEFAAELGAAQAVGVANCTDALELALRALDIGPGDEVITVSHTAVASVMAIELAGATPVLVDIDPASFTMDVNKLADTVKQRAPGRLKAIIPVHLYGHAADMAAILEIARAQGLRVIEDCAQAHGAKLHGRTVGTFGDLAAYSFYPTKNLAAIGDGGAVVTSDPSLAQRVRELRQYGWRDRYISAIPGMNSRLDELQAAILRVKLRVLKRDNARRRELAKIYAEALANSAVTPPWVRPGVEPVFHQYVVRSPRRDALALYLRPRGVPTAVHYPQPVHTQPAYLNRVAIGAGGLAESERVCQEVLSLPMHAYLKDESVKFAAQQVAGWRP
jgi:dTDP-4-amino-4,6-dideoxygalactose transaminase